MTTVCLLLASNIFMTIAWYGHLKYPNSPLWLAIGVSWLIAFFEYCLQVPANRIGKEHGYNLFQLKVTQEIITLLVFVVFIRIYFREGLRWNHLVAFAFLIGAVYFAFLNDTAPSRAP